LDGVTCATAASWLVGAGRTYLFGLLTFWCEVQLTIWMSFWPLGEVYRKMKASIIFTLSRSRPASSDMEMSPRNTRRVIGSSGASFSSCQNSGLMVRMRAIRTRPPL
jgi:hypothetical protein